MPYERSNIQKMTGYSSGEQPDSDDVIKLNTNENPFPPGPAVAEALAGLRVDSLRRYPPPTAARLRNLIAGYHSIESDNVIVTNGGDELLRLAVATFVEENETVAVAEPSYSLYEVLANAHGCRFLKFDLRENWALPDNFASLLNNAGVKLCFVVNPHAPSGYLTPQEELRNLATGFKGVLVIDEAYADFVDPACGYDCTSLVSEFENVLILRTFSKGYSLAGLRIAYGLGSMALVAPMQYKTKDSYNTDIISQTLAAAALNDMEYVSTTWQYIREQRNMLASQLQDMGFSSYPSQSNFLLVSIPPPLSAEAFYRELKSRGILVRYFNLPRLEDKLRITVGMAESNLKLLEALSAIMQEQG